MRQRDSRTPATLKRLRDVYGPDARPSEGRGDEGVAHAAASRSRSMVLAVAGIVAALLAGGVGGYVLKSGEQVRALTFERAYPDLREVAVGDRSYRLPDDAGFDQGSAYLAAVIDSNPVWVGTQSDGALRCMYVVLGAGDDARNRACTPVGSVGTMLISSQSDPQVSSRADSGWYQLLNVPGSPPVVFYVNDLQ